MRLGEVPGLQVLGCWASPVGGYRSLAGVGSEVLLLIPDVGASLTNPSFSLPSSSLPPPGLVNHVAE